MFGIELPIIWFILIAVLFAGYFLLEGFDFGVGILAPMIGKNRKERNTIVGTIGPVWDGNEVWLITAGGAMFAAFPEWYATLFSGFYIPLFLILLCLIIRIVALEWRKKMDDPRWTKWCDWGLAIGSWGPAILWGIAFANILRGLPIQADHTLLASDAMATIFNPYGIMGGITFTALFTFHGLAFIRLKTAGIVRERTENFVWPVSILAAVTGVIFIVWTVLSLENTTWTWVVAVLIVLLVVAGIITMAMGRDGWSFTFTSVAVVAVAGLLFGILFPNVMPTTLADGTSLDVWNAASNPYTLKFMTWVAIFMVPVVLAYQAWTYWVFSKRLRAEDAMAEKDNAPLKVV